MEFFIMGLIWVLVLFVLVYSLFRISNIVEDIRKDIIFHSSAINQLHSSIGSIRKEMAFDVAKESTTVGTTLPKSITKVYAERLLAQIENAGGTYTFYSDHGQIKISKNDVIYNYFMTTGTIMYNKQIFKKAGADRLIQILKGA